MGLVITIIVALIVAFGIFTLYACLVLASDYYDMMEEHLNSMWSDNKEKNDGNREIF